MIFIILALSTTSNIMKILKRQIIQGESDQVYEKYDETNNSF